MDSKLKDIALLTAAWFFIFAGPAHAYFDLGTGAYLLQLVLGFAFAFWISFRKQVAMFFGKNKPAEKAIETTAEAGGEPVP
jgi:hypothetical protein